MLKARNEANHDLKKNGKLDNPFRFVIRGDRVRCINVSETVEINGVAKHPFVEQNVANAARKTNKRQTNKPTEQIDFSNLQKNGQEEDEE